MDLIKILNTLKTDSDYRFDNFGIEEIGTLSKIQEDAYLETSTRLGGDEQFVCLAIDLDQSSKISAKKQVKTMAKLYEYFTENVVDILNISEFQADYIDIKGDGAFGIYQGSDAIKRAFVAAVTFKTFFEDVVRGKFKSAYDLDLTCKIGISQGKILVKKIGTRKYKNEVWAGKVVNNTYKIMGKSTDIKKNTTQQNHSYLLISQAIYDYLVDNFCDNAILSCGCNGSIPSQNKTNVRSEFSVSDDDNIVDDLIYYTPCKRCETHGDEYLNNILDS